MTGGFWSHTVSRAFGKKKLLFFLLVRNQWVVPKVRWSGLQADIQNHRPQWLKESLLYEVTRNLRLKFWPWKSPSSCLWSSPEAMGLSWEGVRLTSGVIYAEALSMVPCCFNIISNICMWRKYFLYTANLINDWIFLFVFLFLRFIYLFYMSIL